MSEDDNEGRPTLDHIKKLAEDPRWGGNRPGSEPSPETPKTKEGYTEWLNKSYACITITGKFKIMHEDEYGNIVFMEKKSFIDSLEHKRIMVTSPEDGKTKFVPITESWLKSPMRRQYNGIVFNPSKEGHYDGLYNLWRGYGKKPILGDCSPFIDLMKNIICAGNEDNFNYLVGICADMFQRPHQKPGVAVVIRGDEGVGKSFFIEKLSALMNPYSFKTSNPAYVFGDHNGQLKNVVLLHLEEAVWAGSKKDESLLKDLITGPTLPINDKFMPVYLVDNHLHLFISGNPEWIVSAGFKARRIFALHADDHHRRDTSYFSELDKWFHQGGAEALMYWFLNHKIDVDLRLVPTTEELIFQKRQSMSGVQQWLYSIVDSKEMPYGEVIEGKVQVIKALLLNDYNHSPAGQRHQLTELQFGNQLTSLLPLVVDGEEQKSNTNGKVVCVVKTDNVKIRDSRDIRRNGYEWPDNSTIRRTLEFKLGGQCDWTTPDGDWTVLHGNTDFDFSLYKPKS